MYTSTDMDLRDNIHAYIHTLIYNMYIQDIHSDTASSPWTLCCVYAGILGERGWDGWDWTVRSMTQRTNACTVTVTVMAYLFWQVMIILVKSKGDDQWIKSIKRSCTEGTKSYSWKSRKYTREHRWTETQKEQKTYHQGKWTTSPNPLWPMI